MLCHTSTFAKCKVLFWSFFFFFNFPQHKIRWAFSIRYSIIRNSGLLLLRGRREFSPADTGDKLVGRHYQSTRHFDEHGDRLV